MKPADPEIPSHHVKQNICATRKPYRDGRHPKAVKVYTVNNESRYILIQGVPSVGAKQNLVDLCAQFGPLEDHHALDEYPCEDKYTEVYLFKYKRIQSARFAKRKLDDYSFFGGTLHVCYAPEYETVAEVRDKLQDRRRIVAAKIRQHEAGQRVTPSRSTELSRLANPEDSGSSIVPSSVDNTVQQHTQSGLPAPSSIAPQGTFSFKDTLQQHSQSGLPALPGIAPQRNFSFNHTIQQSSESGLPISSSIAPQRNFSNLHSNPSNSGSSHYNNAVVPRPSTTTQSNPMTASTSQPTHSVQSGTTPMWQQLTTDTPQQTFQLPLPPQVSSFIPHSVRGRRRYEFSRVPSAHATLPVGFDERLTGINTVSPASATDDTNTSSDSPVTSNSKAQGTPSSNNQLVPSGPGVKTVTGKFDTSSVVVKDFKGPRTVPKFVPRQALKRKADESQPSENHQVRKSDKLDQDIRKNAFRLGEVQGPEGLSRPSAPAVPRSAENSVKKTIHDIRNKISAVISAKVKHNT